MKTLKLFLCLVMLITSLPAIGQSKREMAFSSSSPNANKLLRTAWVEYADAKIEEGNSHILQALKEDPDFGMAYVSLASLNDDKSEENIRKAESMKLSADERTFMEGLRAVRDKRAANEFFDPLMNKYPKDDYLHLLIMFIVHNQGPAIEIGEKLIRRNPKFAPAYNLLGYGYMQRNDMTKAEAHFDKYIALRPDLANPYDSKGDYFVHIGKPESALPMFEKALAMGMKQSATKVERAKALLKFPKPSEEEVNLIKEMMTARFQAVTSHDVDAMLKNYSDQAVEIFASQRVNVGLPNIRRRMTELPKYGSHINGDFMMGSIYGTGPIAIAIGQFENTWKQLETGREDKQKSDVIFLFRKASDGGWKIITTHFSHPQDVQAQNPKDKESINNLLLDWESIIMEGIDVTERLGELYSPQAIEIFANQMSNIGLPNLKSRWAQFQGSKTIRNSLGSMGIEVIGGRAVAWGIANQDLYPKDSDKLLKFEFPWAMILTKETDDVWRILALHWGAD